MEGWGNSEQTKKSKYNKLIFIVKNEPRRAILQHGFGSTAILQLHYSKTSISRSSGQEVEIAINKIGEVISEMTNALITLPRLNYSTNFYPPYIIRTQIVSSFQWNVPKN